MKCIAHNLIAKVKSNQIVVFLVENSKKNADNSGRQCTLQRKEVETSMKSLRFDNYDLHNHTLPLFSGNYKNKITIISSNLLATVISSVFKRLGQIVFRRYRSKFYTLNLWSRGKQFWFPESPDVSRDKVEGNIRTQGKTKLTSFLRDHTLSVLLYI